MSKPCSLFVSSLLLVTLACRGDRKPPEAPVEVASAGPTTPETSPTSAAAVQPVAAEPVAAKQPECTLAAMEAQGAAWHDGKVCLEQSRPRCDQGDADACMVAATILINGIGGVAKDPAASLALATAACDRRIADACLIAAVQHEKGLGVPADAAKATGFLGRACELGDQRSCQAAASRAPRGAAFIADANLQVESIAADGLELRDLMCAVTGGMPMLGALLIAGTLAKQKRALDRCAPAGQAFAVTWTFTGGKARDVAASGGAEAANACVAKAVARTVSTLDGRCGAVVLVGKPAGAEATLAAVRSGQP